MWLSSTVSCPHYRNRLKGNDSYELWILNEFIIRSFQNVKKNFEFINSTSIRKFAGKVYTRSSIWLSTRQPDLKSPFDRSKRNFDVNLRNDFASNCWDLNITVRICSITAMFELRITYRVDKRMFKTTKFTVLISIETEMRSSWIKIRIAPWNSIVSIEVLSIEFAWNPAI